jgi:signal transduction histidine kinase
MFVTALATMVAIAFLIGRIAARRLKRRISTINRVFGAFGRDAVTTRAPITPANDELDTLSTNLNLVLDRTSLLLRARKDLSDTIAHETRTPLMHIGAKLSKAQLHQLPPAADSLIDDAHGDIRNVQRMLDTLLDIAASEAQRGEMNSLPEMDLSEIASRLAELYAPSAEDMGINFTVHIAENVLMRGEPVQISSLLVNLLDNAFKYGVLKDQTGGYIGLTIRHGPEIIVEDHGQGIPEAIHDQIFERFRRARNGNGGGNGNNGEKGHGLGLALVRAIAERHGLTVTIDNSLTQGEHRGAQFIIR